MIVCASCHKQVPVMSVFCDQCGHPVSRQYYYAPDPWVAAGIGIAAAGLIYDVARDYARRRRCGYCSRSKGFRHVLVPGPDSYLHWYDACNNCGRLNPYVP